MEEEAKKKKDPKGKMPWEADDPADENDKKDKKSKEQCQLDDARSISARQF